MLFDKLSKYCDIISVNSDVKDSCKHIFLSPYYLYMEDKVKDILVKVNPSFSSKYYKNITSQIVNYVYNKFFIHIYPFEFRLAKENGLFKDDVIDSDMQIFFISEISCNKDWINYLFEKYPVLHTAIELFSEHILIYIFELASDFLKDINVLTKVYNVKEEDLVSICLFKGDLHNWKCVSSLVFKNGYIIYYKPRSADNEKFLLSFTKTLISLGLNIKIGIPVFVGRDNYSWHLHISDNESDSLDISQYYFNWGVLQCLFYILGTQDIIPDNILYSKGIPYIIDCESLILRPYIYNDANSLSTYLQKSVLKTGILPDWMFDNANQRTSISSVLFEFRGENKHLPHSSHESYPIKRKHLSDFLSGFTYAYDFLSKHKKIILDLLKENQVDRLYSRVLIHPTMIYSCLLKEQMTPEYLAGFKNIRTLLSSLIQESVYGDHAAAIIDSVKNQITTCNIPYFFTRGNEVDLYTSSLDMVCKNFYQLQNNSEWIKNKLDSLSERDLLYQYNIIEETLKFYFDITEHVKPERIINHINSEVLSSDSHLQAAINILERILKYEIQKDNLIGYVGRTKCLYDGAFQIALHNNSIYDGIAGICIFYMALYRQTHDVNLLNKTKSLFSQICDDIENLNISNSELKNIPISPLTGITGVLYLMECFEELFNESIYKLVINKIQKIILETEQYDYMSGLTGLIIFLYQAKHICDNVKYELMTLCGKRLIELSTISGGVMSWKYLDGARFSSQKTMVLGGYSHGSASISVAFYMLFLQTHDNTYMKAFEMALKHDRSFFSEDIKGWVDGRDTEHKMDSGSWCHGSTGIALSRLQLISLGYYDQLIKKELHYAIPQMVKRLECNLSICHGTMGNLEILHALKNYGYEINCDLNSYERTIIQSILAKSSIWCGDDNYDSLIGLFMGISGIGYQLLRLYSWKTVPSVMCLEVSQENKIFHD